MRCLLAGSWIGLLVCAGVVYGQELQRGLHYYAVENLESGTVQRGTAGSNGIAHDNLILAPNTLHRDWILQAATLEVGSVEFTTPGPGLTVDVPDIFIAPVDSPDSDGDGLHDIGEFIMGTDPSNPDTDDDGVLDGPEVQQGLNPLDGVPARTGIITSRDTPGVAIDICAVNDLAIVADSARGISVFNVFNGMEPTIIAQVDTPGNAMAVSCSGAKIAVADGTAGLAIIDIADPPAAHILFQLSATVLGGSARAVASGGGIAYVGLSSGAIATVDLASGTALERLSLPGGALQDVTLEGDYLYAVKQGTLYVISLVGGRFELVGSVGFAGGVNTANGRMRLFVGGGIAYPVHRKGYATIDVSDPSQPVVITDQETPLFGWKQIVLNGSGLGIAAVSPNQAFDGPHHVSLYNVTDPNNNNTFITEYATPSIARAVGIYNGLAYVADHTAGMHVVNYLAFDVLGVPPSIELDTGFPLDPAVVEEGKPVRITARVTDDVQVRNVEFYLDGVKQLTDGNFPFEFRFVAPQLEPGVRESFLIRARASDTGGNATWTAELLVTLSPDATPPEVVRVAPRSGSALARIGTIAAFFNEPMDAASLNGTGFAVVEVGPDGVFDSGDDVAVAGTVEWREEVLGAFLNPSGPLPAGFYRATVTTAARDLAGNGLANGFIWTFRVFDVADDRDGDGIPDGLEASLGLDPDNPDTDGDGVFDGQEDFDNDGLTNLEEVIIGFDPANADTDGDGIADGAEDSDRDGLRDIDELVAHGTDFNNHDTDGDGFNDGDEVGDQADPLDPTSLPRRLYVGFVAGQVGVRNLVLPIFTGNSVFGNRFSVYNQALPGLVAGHAYNHLMIGVRNVVVPQLLEGHADGSQVGVQNEAKPESISGKSVGPVVSAENQ